MGRSAARCADVRRDGRGGAGPRRLRAGKGRAGGVSRGSVAASDVECCGWDILMGEGRGFTALCG